MRSLTLLNAQQNFYQFPPLISLQLNIAKLTEIIFYCSSQNLNTRGPIEAILKSSGLLHKLVSHTLQRTFCRFTLGYVVLLLPVSHFRQKASYLFLAFIWKIPQISGIANKGNRL